MALSARIPPQKQVLPEEAFYSLFSSFLNPFCENKFSATKQPYYTLPFGKRQSFPAIIDSMHREAGADGGTGKSPYQQTGRAAPCLMCCPSYPFYSCQVPRIGGTLFGSFDEYLHFPLTPVGPCIIRDPLQDGFFVFRRSIFPV